MTACQNDMATEQEEYFLKHAHRAKPRRIVDAPTKDCVDCGDEIPKARQDITGGTDLCTECAGYRGF